MRLKSLHIISFGGLNNRHIDLESGLNVISGENESGKSSAAMFIKFIFYGLSGKGLRSLPSERKRYINRETGQAAGYIIADTEDGREFRLERAIITSDKAAPRERVKIINTQTGECITGQNPGEYFFGVPEEVFIDTCFISQSTALKPRLGNTAGTKGAVENLLTSADENVDIKKALKRLDETRRGLFHKYKTGGEIKELREKRDTLAAELEIASAKSAEILTITTSIEDIKKRLATLEEARAKYDGIFDALDKITVMRKIDSLEESHDKITATEQAIYAIDSSPFGDGFEDALLESERDIRTYDEKCAAYDSLLAEAEDSEEPIEELPSAGDIAEEVHGLEISSRIQFSVAIALLISGIIGLAAVIFLYYFNTDIFILPLIMTVALITVGIAFIMKYAKSSAKLNRILDEWDAESPDEIENAVSEKLLTMDRATMQTEERESMIASLESAKLLFDIACERVSALAEAAEIEVYDDIYDTLDALHEVAEGVSEKRAKLVTKLENLRGRADILAEQLDGVDTLNAELESRNIRTTPLGKIAAELDGTGIKNLRRESDFTENAIRASMKQKSDLDERLAQIGKPSADPDTLASRLSALDGMIEELTIRHDACELAMEAISSAGESMRSGVIPQIAERASKMISEATLGAHGSLTLDSSFNAGLTTDDDVLTSEFLSRGTSDLSYMALRIAIADKVFSSEPPIMVFDESFAHIDPQRTEATFRLLTGNQYVLLTCRSDDTVAAEKIGANVINL